MTLRGRKWERKNSLWIIWSFFTLACAGFAYIGIRAKEKKWVIAGIIYFATLWGGIIALGQVESEATVEIISALWSLCYIVSIAHSFSVKKQYLIKWDKILIEQKLENEKEKVRRENEIENEKIKLKMEVEQNKEKLLKEYEEVKERNKKLSNELEKKNKKEAEINRTKLLKEYEEEKESNAKLCKQLEEQKQKEAKAVILEKGKITTTEDEPIIMEESSNDTLENENEKKLMHTQQTGGNREKKQDEKENDSEISSFIGGIITIVIVIATLIYINPFGIGEIENAELAEINCGSDLVNNVFIVTPKENQIDIKAIDGKDGMVVVRIEIEDEDLLKYCIYGDNVEEIYYGFVPTSTGSSHYYYWGKNEKEVKENMGW